jgi:hypothetical protein
MQLRQAQVESQTERAGRPANQTKVFYMAQVVAFVSNRGAASVADAQSF